MSAALAKCVATAASAAAPICGIPMDRLDLSGLGGVTVDEFKHMLARMNVAPVLQTLSLRGTRLTAQHIKCLDRFFLRRQVTEIHEFDVADMYMYGELEGVRSWGTSIERTKLMRDPDPLVPESSGEQRTAEWEAAEQQSQSLTQHRQIQASWGRPFDAHHTLPTSHGFDQIIQLEQSHNARLQYWGRHLSALGLPSDPVEAFSPDSWLRERYEKPMCEDMVSDHLWLAQQLEIARDAWKATRRLIRRYHTHVHALSTALSNRSSDDYEVDHMADRWLPIGYSETVGAAAAEAFRATLRWCLDDACAQLTHLRLADAYIPTDRDALELLRMLPRLEWLDARLVDDTPYFGRTDRWGWTVECSSILGYRTHKSETALDSPDGFSQLRDLMLAFDSDVSKKEYFKHHRSWATPENEEEHTQEWAQLDLIWQCFAECVNPARVRGCKLGRRSLSWFNEAIDTAVRHRDTDQMQSQHMADDASAELQPQSQTLPPLDDDDGPHDASVMQQDQQNATSVHDPFVKRWKVLELHAAMQQADRRSTENVHTILVAVLDSGIDLAHPWFLESVLHCTSFLPNDQSDSVQCYQPVRGPTEQASLRFVARHPIGPSAPELAKLQHRSDSTRLNHGTHCAGIIRQIAPDAKLLIAQVTTSKWKQIASSRSSDVPPNVQALVSGIRWSMQRGANVISISLGLNTHHPSLLAAVNNAISAGIHVVCSASNYGRTSDYPVMYPARYGHTICVGSHNDHGQPSKFSSVGRELDFLAPGERVWSSMPHGQFGCMDGTSMSAPMVAGLVACILRMHHMLWPERPLPDPIQMKNFLRTCCTSPGHHDESSGYGVLQPDLLFKPFQNHNSSAGASEQWDFEFGKRSWERAFQP